MFEWLKFWKWFSRNSADNIIYWVQAMPDGSFSKANGTENAPENEIPDNVLSNIRTGKVKKLSDLQTIARRFHFPNEESRDEFFALCQQASAVPQPEKRAPVAATATDDFDKWAAANPTAKGAGGMSEQDFFATVLGDETEHHLAKSLTGPAKALAIGSKKDGDKSRIAIEEISIEAGETKEYATEKDLSRVKAGQLGIALRRIYYDRAHAMQMLQAIAEGKQKK